MNERDAKREADEKLRPMNQSLESIGSATNFKTYVNETYIPVVLPLMATSTQARYRASSTITYCQHSEVVSARSRKLAASKILQRHGGRQLGA
jgi:hypothetical protein